MLFFCCVLQTPLIAQCTLLCNDGLQVSLDQSGQALITSSLMAPNAGGTCPGPLTITLYNQVGQQLPNPLGCAQIGQVVTAKVKHTSSGNSCSGTLQVIDALSPTLNNCADKYIFCNEDSAPGSIGSPFGTDNCTAPGNLNFSHFDTETSLNCGTYQNGVPVLKRIDRSWTVSDDHGNSSTCLQKVWLKHITFADVTFPPNRDNLSTPALDCSQTPDDLSITGEPTVNGIPVGASPECEMSVSYSDQTIMHCAPAGFTVLRNWTAIDFCSGTFTNRIQIIRVKDTEAPSLLAPQDLTVGTDGFLCTGSVTLPQAVSSDQCSAVTVVPSWNYGNGFGPFSGVAEGEHLVIYTATDACGNVSTATMKVTVLDSSPPQAICGSSLQVSLSSNGAGYVNAAIVNQGSFDNCGPVFLSISRDELEYFSQVQVTCADQGAPIMLTLKVTDASGLENFCQMEVTVRDLLKPMIQCPPNLTLNCLQDYNNLSLTGQAVASDNCALKSMIHQDLANIQPCNIGSVTRWWIATDSAANTKSCSQQITVNPINSSTVAFPANISVANCAGPGSLLPAATGMPVMGGQSCSPLSVNYSDQTFSIAPPSCFRIFRVWKVIDHCIYNLNGGSAGIWEQTQIIDVMDQSAPILSIPPDLMVETSLFNGMADVSLPDITATDCSSQITYSNNSNFSNSGNTTNASGQYPPGVHLVTFTAIDGCGNIGQQTLKITVRDLTPPKAVCLTGVSIQIQSSGSVSLDPMQLDAGSSDPYSPQSSLSLSAAPSLFTCQQIGLNPVTLTVKDTSGNIASCNTHVLVQDNAQICGNNGGLEYQVTGRIRTEAGIPVHNIPVSILSEGFMEQTSCDSSGYFEFSTIPANEAYILSPDNNSNWVNGVTTYDLVLISKHILGTEPFNSPYKMLAADANRSGSITTFDVLQLRKVILGILDSLPNNTSWRFVNAGLVFQDLQNPFSTPVSSGIVIDSLVSDLSEQNFIGIKVGDVNGSTNPAMARTPQDTLFLNLSDRDFQAGEPFAIPILFDQWMQLEGLQCELRLDASLLQLERVEYTRPELLGQSNLAMSSSGSLLLSWDKASAAKSDGIPTDAPLFILHLKGKASSNLHSAMTISGDRLSPEAYRIGNEEPAAISIEFKKSDPEELMRLLEIFPNPAMGTFYVQNPFEGTHTCISILDARGQSIWTREGLFPETVEVPETVCPTPGLYWVQLKSPTQTLTGKVFVMPVK
jgi:hypothetical protein